MKKTNLIALALIAALTLSALPIKAQNNKPAAAPSSPSSSSSGRGNVEGITAAQIRDYLTFIASDELEGRDTPSRGLDTAARYLASQVSRWGLKPAGDDGTYFQRIAMRRNKIDPAPTRVEFNHQTFSYGEDFLASAVAGSASGQLVYVSHGWVFKAKNIDPYKGLDVKDKIVVAISGGVPKGVTQADLGGKQGEDWEFPSNAAQKRGAKAIIAVPSFATWANWAQGRQNATERGSVVVEKFQAANNAPFPSITASPRLLNALFQGERSSGTVIFNRAAAGEPVEPFELKAEKKVGLTVGVKAEPIGTQNVVAVLEGSDPTLKNEYVAIGAHYDHVGIGPEVNGDAIYNGADDDASGTAAVLAMAEAFARGPRPKRSILFVWHTGEEKGLWGSQYFTDYPTIPLNQIIAQLNIDMIGRTKKEGDTKPANQTLLKTGEVFVVGSKMMSTELGELSEAVNKSYHNLVFNYKYDDPKDPERIFFRSDHYNYARKGIPIIFYTGGDHEDYHKPSDTADKIDYQHMEKVTRTIYATAWELAHRPARPRVDKSLPAGLTGQ